MRSAMTGVGAVLAVVLLGGCQGAAPVEKPLTPVRVSQAQPYAGSGGVRYSASITPYQQVDLAFKVSGYIRDVLQLPGVDGRSRDVQEGDRVAKGSVLARVRETDYAEKVNQARSQLAEAQALWEQARAEMDRAEALFAHQSLTRPDYEAAQARLAVAQAKVDGARAQLEVAGAALEDCALRAPMKAIVLSRSVESGELVAQGTVGFVLADTTSVKAVFGVSDVTLGQLRLGDPLSVRTEALPGEEFHGRISRIAPSADPKSRVFEVELTIPNPGGRLKSGLIASLQVGETAPAEASPAVPLSAVVRQPGDADGYAVFVVSDEDGRQVARVRGVKLGEALGNAVVVSDGLKAGELVVVTGATLVADGEAVRVVP